MTRRRLIALALAAPLLGIAGPRTAAEPAPKETTWEELMPKDWDPMKEFRAGDTGLVPEGSVKERNLMRQMRELWDNAPTNPRWTVRACACPATWCRWRRSRAS